MPEQRGVEGSVAAVGWWLLWELRYLRLTVVSL